MASLSLPLSANEIINTLTGNVSQRILPQLQEANSNIQQLSFMWGHPIELKNTLKEMTEARSQKYLKFPVVMLFSDILSSPSSVKGAFQDLTLNIVIAMSTLPTYKASQREAKNFIPILRPIYQALIEEIYRSGYFWVQAQRDILGRDIERYFWGAGSTQGNTENFFNDCIDAIEIKNLKLTQARPGNAITQNTFMQFVQYFLQQTRAEIVVGVDSNTISNSFFTQPILSIVADTQTYVIDVNFTQDADAGTITGLGDLSFFNGQVIIANR